MGGKLGELQPGFEVLEGEEKDLEEPLAIEACDPLRLFLLFLLLLSEDTELALEDLFENRPIVEGGFIYLFIWLDSAVRNRFDAGKGVGSR